MSINTLAYAKIFQKELDREATAEALTGWMEANAGQVIYNGGDEVKIPKMSLQGLGDYSRDNGYAQGSVSLSYETRSMSLDRGRKFQLDALDVHETNFVATAGAVMGEFQRLHVIPEIDAYRLSKAATAAITRNTVSNTGLVETGYTPAAATALAKLKGAIAVIRDYGFNGQLVCHATSGFKTQLELGLAAQLRAVTWHHNGIDTIVPGVDDVPIIETPQNRMYTAITMYDGKTPGATAAAAEYKLTADARVDSTKTYYTRSGSSPNYTYTKVASPADASIATYYEMVSPAVEAAADQTGGGYVKGGSASDINFIVMAQTAPIAVSKQDVMRIFDPMTYQNANAWSLDYRRYHDMWVKDNAVLGIAVNTK